MNTMDHEEREAHHILDLAKAGGAVPRSTIDWALRVTGDLLGVKDFNEDGEQILVLERRTAS